MYTRDSIDLFENLMKQLHELQLRILKHLTYVQWSTFSELKDSLWVASNTLTFHLNTLCDAWRCTKSDGNYFLSKHGKEYANTMDTGEYIVKKQVKVWVMICALQCHNDSYSVLIQTRTKQPFWWKQWFITWKIHWWESPLTTARRELYEETGLTWSAELIDVLHLQEYDYETQWHLSDSYLFLCRVLNPSWTLRDSREWVLQRVKREDLITTITDPYSTVGNLMRHVDRCIDHTWAITFVEQSQYTADF